MKTLDEIDLRAGELEELREGELAVDVNRAFGASQAGDG